METALKDEKKLQTIESGCLVASGGTKFCFNNTTPVQQDQMMDQFFDEEGKWKNVMMPFFQENGFNSN